MSITGDMIIDYEMATPDEFLDFYYDQAMSQHYSDLEEMAQEKDSNDTNIQ